MIQSESVNRRLLSGLAHGDIFVRSTALALIASDPKPGIEATRLAIAAFERDGHREAFERPPPDLQRTHRTDPRLHPRLEYAGASGAGSQGLRQDGARLPSR